MPNPVTKVEIAFAVGPYVESPTWTDVTTYVRAFSVRRGRASEVENFEAGTANLVLDNRDRRFDPFYTSGPYYGNLVPRRQIRISGIVGATSYAIFRGYIDGWPVTLTDAGYDSTVTLSCYDTLGLIADEELPDDLSDAYIRSFSPRHYYPLDDPIDGLTPTTVVCNDAGSLPLDLKPTVTSAQTRIGNLDGMAPALANTSLSLDDPVEVRLQGYNSGIITTPAAMTVALWWVLSQPTISTLITQVVSGFVVEASYSLSTATLTVDVTNSSTGNRNRYTATSFTVDTTIPHHLAVVVAAGGTATVYLDGVAVSMSVAASSLIVDRSESVLLRAGQYQQLAVIPSALTQTQVQQLYLLGNSKLPEGTVARFQRIIGYTSVPAGLTATPSTTYVANLMQIGAGGPPVTQELQTLADSEGGNVYVSKTGVLTLTSRNAIFEGRSLTSQATFGDTGITLAPELAYRVDADTMRNDLAIGYSGDGTIQITDATSVAAYGTNGGSWKTQLSTVDQAETLGNLLVGFSKEPTPVLDPVRVNVADTSAGWDSVLALELLDRITVNVVPRVGSMIVLKQIVQAIEHNVTPGTWQTTLTGSTRFTNPFIIGESLLGGSDLLV
jgi:hypothetical protein